MSEPYFLKEPPVKGKYYVQDATVLPFGSMAGAKIPREPTEFGRRILEACEAEGRSPTSAERDSGISKGYLSRMIYGDRGGTALDPQKVKALARLLHVNFEWLFVGDGPMRREGRAPTPAEEAIVFARQQGTREDAIRAAWDRNKDRVGEMTAIDWVLAIDNEARKLERAGVPRPERVHAMKEQIQKQKSKLEKQKKERDAERQKTEAFDAEVRNFMVVTGGRGA